MDDIVALFLSYYNQYSHIDIYFKSYCEGGLTLDQIFFLSEYAVKRERDKTLTLAAMHGVDVSKLLTPEERAEKETKWDPKEPLFGDPEMYKNMTEEEKKQATAALMAKLKKTGLPVNTKTKRKTE